MRKSQTLIPEDELVSLLKRKDKKAFAMLYDNYCAALYGIVLKIVRSENLAEDVLQDAFVKIWKNIESYDKTKGTLFTWILNIARNVAIDKTRSQEFKTTSKIRSVDDNVGIVDKQLSGEIPIDYIGLEKVILKLKPEHQVIIDYIYFKGYTQVEVAKALGIPLGTVKTRVKLAISHLRELIT